MRNIWFLSPLVPSKPENLALLSLYIFDEGVFIFQFLNDKIYTYLLFDIILNFINLLSRELSFAQFVYFLREVCLFFNF